MESKTKNKKRKRVITDADLNDLALLSVLNQSCSNYERMQSIGFTAGMGPALKKIYKNDPKTLSKVLHDNLEFINTHNTLLPYLQGLMLSLYEGGEDPEVVKKIKISLFGPLAGIGDALFWFTLLPITAGICASLSDQGNVLGPIVFFLVFLVAFLLRFPLARMGYKTGTKALDKIQENTKRVSNAASVLGVTILGGLIASYVTLTVKTTIDIGHDATVSLQTDFFDKILPNLLPFAFTFLIYFLLRKKVNTTVLIVGIIIASIVFSFFGIL